MFGEIKSHIANGKVSVIVTCYNYGRYLSDALQSVLDQTYKKWECIIVDDGSTDNTKIIAAEFEGRDERFKYCYQDNAGLSAARNKGLDLASGDYIQFLDADDLLVNTKFETQIKLYNNYTKADVLYTDYELMSEDGKEKWNNKDTNWIQIVGDPFKCFLNKWEKGFSIPIHCNLFRRKCFESIRFNTALPTHEDIELQLRLALSGCSYEYVDKVLVYYRVHQNSMARNYTNMHRGYLMALLSVLKFPRLSFGNRLRVINRYNQEFRNAWFSFLKRRKMNMFRIIFIPGAFFLNIEAALVLFIYVIIRLMEAF